MKYKVQIVERDQAELNGYDEQDEPTLVLDIRGNDLSTLIGRRGETLDSLQYLVRLLVAKELGHYLHVVLDVEGYKAHRAQTLKQLALRMAERVAATHKPAALEPMPANERRLVHLALRDHHAGAHGKRGRGRKSQSHDHSAILQALKSTSGEACTMTNGNQARLSLVICHG